MTTLSPVPAHLSASATASPGARAGAVPALLHPFAKPAADAAGFVRMVRGEGALVFDERGRRYVDAMASLWYCNVGHARAEVTGGTAKGTRLYSLQAETINGAAITVGTTLPDPPPTLHWRAIAMQGIASAPGATQPPLRGGQVRVTGTFAQQLQTALPAGATLVITDDALRYAPAAAPIAPQTDATTVMPRPSASQSMPVKP